MAGFTATRRLTATYEDVQWLVNNEDHLVRVVAIVALGQAQHAAALIRALEPMTPAFTSNDLVAAAISSLEVQPGTDKEEAARTVQRDGQIFEVLSWAAMVESMADDSFLARDPHLGSTTQGLDGLLLKLDPETHQVTKTVVIEDKCSEDPRRMFRAKVLPGFQEHHQNLRTPDLVATASALLRNIGDATSAVQRAAAVLDLAKRAYRASLALEIGFDSSPQRQNLFNGYEALDGVQPEDLEGGGIVVGTRLRPWFEQFANRVRDVLAAMESPGV